MKTWLIILGFVAVILLLILGFSVLYGTVLLAAARRHVIKERRKYADKLHGCLPKSDCGECGLTSCGEYAQKAAENGDFPSECPYISSEDKESWAADYRQYRSELTERAEKSHRTESQRRKFFK